MATTAQNNVSVLEKNYLPEALVATTDQTINQGDLVYWDSTNSTVTPLSSAAQVAGNYLGQADSSVPGTIYSGDAALPYVRVLAKGCVFVNSTAGETYNHFDWVTIGADAQTVTKVAATSANRVGFVIISPPGLGSPRAKAATPTLETVGGSAQVRIRIQLDPKHPAAAAI